MYIIDRVINLQKFISFWRPSSLPVVWPWIPLGDFPPQTPDESPLFPNPESTPEVRYPTLSL